MTPKILSLEEIEQIENSLVPAALLGDAVAARFIATARAYHELMEKWQDEAVKELSNCCGATVFRSLNMAKLCNNCNKPCNVVKTEDKPHAPTIKAIVEAFESVIRETALEKVDAGDIKLVLHRLRSILKEL